MNKVSVHELVQLAKSVGNDELVYRIQAHGIAPPDGWVLIPNDYWRLNNDSF